jgi:hypothetical protein
MEIVNDIHRPDVNGTLPKMTAICETVRSEMVNLAPMMRIETNDNIMSSVSVTGSLDPKDSWNGGIFQNSRYFIFSITPEKGARYYTGEDKITVELISSSYKIKTKFRKYTATTAKVTAKIQDWIVSAQLEVG